jgi:DNA-binding NarL/FixJ family response regulator
VQTRVVIFSSHQLLAEGVASRLHQYLPQLELTFVDSRQPDSLAQIKAVQPSVLIIDVSDTEAARLCSLSELLLLLPMVKVFRLDPHQDQIQVVTLEKHPAQNVHDLVELIEKGPAPS